MTLLLLQLIFSITLSVLVYNLIPRDGLYALFLEKKLNHLNQSSLFTAAAKKAFAILPPKWQQLWQQKYASEMSLIFNQPHLATIQTEVWLAIKLLTGLAGVTIGVLSSSLVFLVCLSYLGFKLPDLWLNQQNKIRKEEMEKDLPDLIDVMVICLEAGLTFDQAAKIYTLKFNNPLTVELHKFLAAVATGKSRQVALEELAAKNNFEEIGLFTSTVMQAEKLGTPLAKALKQISQLTRERQQRKIKELVAKAPVKMLFPTAALILPALLIVVVGPMMIKLFSSGGWS